MRKLRATDSSFSSALSSILEGREEATNDVSAIVEVIISHIRKEGDAALIRLTEQFDRHQLTTQTMRVSAEETANALALCEPELMTSLKVAAKRIRAYSEKQMPADLDYVDESGTRLGHRWSALDAVGLYVPGGTAAYPSSVFDECDSCQGGGRQTLSRGGSVP